jgi:hypothetical protein
MQATGIAAAEQLRIWQSSDFGNGDGSDFCCGAFPGRDWNSLPSPINPTRQRPNWPTWAVSAIRLGGRCRPLRSVP